MPLRKSRRCWRAAVALPATERHQLVELTRGNPALLTLFINLYRQGEPLERAMRQFANAPSLELLLSRIWRRLADAERETAMAMAVFRGVAPQDAWHPDACAPLLARDLAHMDGQGGIALLPFVREFVLPHTPPDLKATLHLAAAAIRETRGEYTAAAYHYVEGRQPALAV